MERSSNWQGWLALVLAAAALAVALSGRFAPTWSATVAAPAAPAAPVAPAAPAAPSAPDVRGGDGRFERGQWGPPGFMREDFDRELQRGGFGPGHHGWGPGRGHGFGPFGFLGLLFGLGKLIALGMLAWLLLRMFRQRNGPPAAPAAAGPAPTTPAGHDPRVE